MKTHFQKFGFLYLLLLLSLLTACSAQTSQILPEFIQNAPPRVQEAYHFAHEHPEMLVNQPCYCGCGPMGHISNLDCFVQEFDEVGNVTWDSHASGCGICVDIALDVKRMEEEGWSQLQIRFYIDATYGQFGPSTDTPMPEA